MSAAPKGERSTLVFIHGGGVGPWMWGHQADYFSPNFTVLTPALPGHDTNSRSVFSTHRQAAEAVARQVGLPEQPRPLTVIGFSLGGQTAVQLAASYPDLVGRLVVVSSLLQPWRGAGALSLVAAGSARLSRNRRFAKAQAAQLSVPSAMFEDYYALSRSISARTVRNLIYANFSFTVPAPVRASSRPVLLMAGDREDALLLRGMESLHSKFPNSTLRIHHGSGHGLPLAQPALFNDCLHQWLISTGG
jgi:pimeloyl-ACP methyl ester carboxylesterase